MDFKVGDRVIHLVRNHSWSKRSKCRIEKQEEYAGVIVRRTEKTAFVRLDGMNEKAAAKTMPLHHTEERMNKPTWINGPDNKAMGVKYIIPIESFDAKGVRWMRVFIFKSKNISYSSVSDKRVVCRYFADPEMEIQNCGNTGSWALDGSGWRDCMCEDCVSGREEVKKGWMPK